MAGWDVDCSVLVTEVSGKEIEVLVSVATAEVDRLVLIAALIGREVATGSVLVIGIVFVLTSLLLSEGEEEA